MLVASHVVPKSLKTCGHNHAAGPFLSYLSKGVQLVWLQLSLVCVHMACRGQHVLIKQSQTKSSYRVTS